jgi:hypothetical protein
LDTNTIEVTGGHITGHNYKTFEVPTKKFSVTANGTYYLYIDADGLEFQLSTSIIEDAPTLAIVERLNDSFSITDTRPSSFSNIVPYLPEENSSNMFISRHSIVGDGTKSAWTLAYLPIHGSVLISSRSGLFLHE